MLADDAGRYTAAELATGLLVHPAAISGAVRYLVDARLPVLGRWRAGLDEAISLVGAHRRGGQRLVKTREFFAFLEEEMLAVMDRWARRHRGGAG